MFGNWTAPFQFKHNNQRSTEDDAEAQERLLQKDVSLHTQSRLGRSTCVLAGIFGVVLGVLAAIIYFLWISPAQCLRGKNAALRQCSYWSPILDAVEIPTYTAMMNGTLWPPLNPSIARQPPSAENDAAWEYYEHIRTHVVTGDTITKLGKDPDKVAKFDDKHWGFGPDAYMAQLDVMHQIHCLNQLRKVAFRDYPGYHPTQMENHHQSMWWVHLSHCVDMLLQNIKCSANTDLITLAWIEDYRVPYPNFNVRHKCRDFEALDKWNQEHAVDDEKFGSMPVPEDAYLWPAPWKHPDSELGHPLGDNPFPGEDRKLGQNPESGHAQ